METEKVCVNLSADELGRLDLLVARGVYVNRTDVVRAALRREFREHDWDDAIAKNLAEGSHNKLGQLGIGYFRITADALEQAVSDGHRVDIVCAGIVKIDDDVTPDLAEQGVGKMRILGSLRGPKAVLERLAARAEGKHR